MQRTVSTTPFLPKNTKFYLFLSGLCTTCIMMNSLVFTTYCCPFVFNCSLFYHIRSRSLLSCLPSWVGLDLRTTSKRLHFHRPFIHSSSGILPAAHPRFSWCFCLIRSRYLAPVNLVACRVIFLCSSRCFLPRLSLCSPPLTLLFDTKPGFCLFYSSYL
jgi:hypothetical protein